MKREAFRHPKTLDLAARLGIQHAYAFAHISYLLNAAADIAPQGNIGKWSHGVIARSAEWLGDPDTFVEALVSSGWLDQHPVVGLLIHDWPDHAERFVKAKLARERTWFHWAYYVDGSRTWDAPDGLVLAFPDGTKSSPPATDCHATATSANASNTTSPTVEPTVDGSPPRDPTKPIPTKPIPTKPKQRAPSKSGFNSAYSVAFEAWYAAYPKHVAKDKAAAAFGRAIGRIAEERQCGVDDAAAWLLGVTRAFASSPAGRASDLPGDLKFVAYPASWLNAGHYNDDPNEWNRAHGNGSQKLQRPRAVKGIGDDDG